METVKVLTILWHEGDAKGFTDFIPLSWLASREQRHIISHKVTGPQGSVHNAKCDILIEKKSAILDYSVHSVFNNQQGMYLGHLRLNFGNGNPIEIVTAEWKGIYDDNFSSHSNTVSVMDLIVTGPTASEKSVWPEESAVEGAIKIVEHRRRERNQALSNRKKENFKIIHGNLACEACGFNFELEYGGIGAGFAEVHHEKAIKKGERNTKLNDLFILCANCHRMIHRTVPMLSVWDFKRRYLSSKQV